MMQTMTSGVLAIAARLGRAVWWCGLPTLFIGWFLLPNHGVLPRPAALYAAASALEPVSPLAAEIVLEYTFALAALIVAVGTALWSHHRRTRIVRAETFLVLTAVAGLETCARMTWFFSCSGGLPPSIDGMHRGLHAAATATLVMMTAPLLAAAVLARWRAGGVAGPMPRMHALAILGATLSVLAIWFAFEKLLLRV